MLEETIQFMKPFAMDEYKRMHANDTIRLASYLDSYFENIGSFTIIGSFQRANTTANLVTSNGKLFAQKTHCHDDEDWLLHFNVLDEVYSMLILHQKLSMIPFFPKLIHIHVNEKLTRITTEFVPLSFSDVFTKNLPQCFLKHRITELLTAISWLHGLGLVHRDIKPENIRFQANGTLVLLDYDTCCARDSNTWLTRPVCTAHTRAPELYIAPGKKCYELSRYDGYATDIFSAACVILCMCLDCKLPFDNEPQIEREKQIKAFSK
jgi:serine/threonine protein kinase